MFTREELRKKLLELREEALDCRSEGYVYLRNDGKILYGKEVPQYTGNRYEVLAAYETPLRYKSGRKAGLPKVPIWELEEYENTIVAHYFGTIE